MCVWKDGHLILFLHNAIFVLFILQFESSFSHKPSLFNKFWQTYPSAEEVLQVRECCQGKIEGLNCCFMDFVSI